MRNTLLQLYSGRWSRTHAADLQRAAIEGCRLVESWLLARQARFPILVASGIETMTTARWNVTVKGGRCPHWR